MKKIIVAFIFIFSVALLIDSCKTASIAKNPVKKGQWQMQCNCGTGCCRIWTTAGTCVAKPTSCPVCGDKFIYEINYWDCLE